VVSIYEPAGNMTIKQLFNIVTPLTIFSAMGVIAIGYGFVNPSQPNNALQFIFGVPMALSGVSMHLLVFHLFKKNTLYTWIFEAIFVAICWYQFRYVW
jgi:hypothetical protein